MKKSFAAIMLALFTMLLPLSGAEKFTRTWGQGYRLYDYSEYTDGNYRSNFVSIPQSRMLNYKDGFKWKVGVFEVDGNTLYLGWDNEGDLQLYDENKKLYSVKDSWKTKEESFFQYENGIGEGRVFEIELKDKKYTVAIAGISSKKAGIYSDEYGFRLWVENESATDSALSSTINKRLNYDSADIMEGVYKPGWKRIWGKIDEKSRIYTYTYKGTEFTCDWDRDAEKSLKNADGSQLALSNVSGFYLTYKDSKGKVMDGYGMGLEADAQIGKNKVKIAVVSYDGFKRVFVKDATGYPVLPVVKAAPAKKAEKAKSSGKGAAFKRDYKLWARVYSKDDVLKGIYKPNYKMIPQKGVENYTLTWTPNGGEPVKYDIHGGLFDFGICDATVHLVPDLGWDVLPFDTGFRGEKWKLIRNNKVVVEGINESAIEADVWRYGEHMDNIVIVPVDIEKGEYKLFVKTGPDEEAALCEKDKLGFEYYDYIDLHAGLYKPGFKYLKKTRDASENEDKLFEGSGQMDKVFVYSYNGEEFMIGPTQDPATAVKRMDGTVIHNPEVQIRYRIEDENGKSLCLPGLSYGWEGKVKLGNKEVILSVLKWNYSVSVFVKDLK